MISEPNIENGVVVVEVLQGLPRREPDGSDISCPGFRDAMLPRSRCCTYLASADPSSATPAVLTVHKRDEMTQTFDSERAATAVARDFDRACDEWMARANTRRGQRNFVQRGLTPPEPGVAFHSTWNNEWVTTDNIRHYADALGDKNPLWRSEDYAITTHWGGIIAPPTFIDVISITAVHDHRALPPNSEAFIAGSTRRMYRPLRPGDRIRVMDVYLGVEEKKRPAGDGRLFIETFRRHYVNQNDEVVVAADSPCIHIASEDPDALANAFGKTEPHSWTDEEIEAFWEADTRRTRRGADTLFWDDVNVGDALPPLAMHPLDATDVWVFLGVTGYQAAFDVRWDIMRHAQDWVTRDERTNIPQMGDLLHLLPEHAKTRAGAWPFGTAAQSEGLLGRMISDWMGDDGFLVELSCRARRPNFLGDASTMTGKVVGKRIDGRRNVIDLEVACTNQDGVVHMPGTAVVALPSRDGADLEVSW
jgi:acyl dehydratase